MSGHGHADHGGNKGVALLISVLALVLAISETLGKSAQTAALSYDAKYASWTRKVVRSLRRLQEAATAPLVMSAQNIARALKASRRQD